MLMHKPQKFLCFLGMYYRPRFNHTSLELDCISLRGVLYTQWIRAKIREQFLIELDTVCLRLAEESNRTYVIIFRLFTPF